MERIQLPLSSSMPILTILFIHGEKAHLLYFFRTAYEAANQPKELLIVKDATHVDLYDRMDKIPFDNITAFFNKYLNKR